MSSPTSSSPSQTTLPASTGTICITARASVDLPQPDFADDPSVSPGFSSKLTPSTALSLRGRVQGHDPGLLHVEPDLEVVD